MTPAEIRQEIAGARYDLGRAMGMYGDDFAATLRQARDRIVRVLETVPAAPGPPQPEPQAQRPGTMSEKLVMPINVVSVIDDEMV